MKSKTTFLLFILVAIIMTACNDSAQPSPVAPTSEPETAPVELAIEPVTEAGQTDSDPIPVEALMNATYSGIYDDPVTLTNGLFEDDPFTVQYLDGSELYGNLDGDGIEDAVVFLLERGGGTANIIYIAAQLNQDGMPLDAGAVRLDEVSVKSAEFEDGQVLLEIITMGPGDGDCCPSYKASKTYAVQDGSLTEIGEVDQDLARVSADDLNGTSWTLVELNYEQPVLPDTGVTINFQENQISGSGGCNNFNSSFELGNENPFVMTISPIAATKMACPNPILDQETAFFTALENVSQWNYSFGQLALYFAHKNGELGRLLFTPGVQSGAEMESTGKSDDELAREQGDQMALINPPPALSEKELDITEVPCELGQPTGPNEVEGETYFCGIFTVPMRWDNPDGPRLDLHFMVAKATGENPEPDPLVYLAGGPGQSAVIGKLDPYSLVRPTRDIVRMDQRGTGLSPRLGLEECLVFGLWNEGASEDVQLLIEFIQADNEGVTQSPEADVQMQSEVNRICATQFANAGLDLDSFTTEESARDMVALLQALGYDTFNLHGISYGTRLAMIIMKLLPQIENAPTLRSVVLDSTLPPSIYLLSSLSHSTHDQVVQMLDECEMDEACNTVYPNLKDRLGALLTQLEAAPLTINGETITLDDVVQTLTNLNGTRAGYMPLMIAELEQGSAGTYLALRDGTAGTDEPEGGAGFDLSDPVQLFISESMRVVVGDSGESMLAIEVLAGISQVFQEADDPLPALQTFFAENYEGDVLARLNELLAQLTPEDIANSSFVAQFKGAQDETAVELTPEEQAAEELRSQKTLSLVSVAYFLNINIHCIEDYQFESLEDGLKVANELAFPLLADLPMMEAAATQCTNWPVSAAPLDVKDPVNSPVPTLILQGAYDTATPVYMGQHAQAELENSTLVLIPQQGHEVWHSASNCAGQIATAFVLNPEQELDLSCLVARQPQWALP